MLGLLAIILGLQGPALVTIADKPSCQRCRIMLFDRVRVGDADGDGAMVDFETVTVDRRGFFLVTTSRPRYRILAYHSTGKFIRRIGSQGAGPAEFARVSAILPIHGDSLLVFDRGNARLATLDSNWVPVRTEPFIGTVYAALPLGQGFVASGTRFPTQSLKPVVILNGNRRVVAHIGDTTHVHGGIVPIALSPDGVWTGERQAYRLRLWSLSGRLQREIVREADWFRPY